MYHWLLSYPAGDRRHGTGQPAEVSEWATGRAVGRSVSTLDRSGPFVRSFRDRHWSTDGPLNATGPHGGGMSGVAERATEAGGFLSSALLDGPMLVAKCATSTSMATATAIHTSYKYVRYTCTRA